MVRQKHVTSKQEVNGIILGGGGSSGERVSSGRVSGVGITGGSAAAHSSRVLPLRRLPSCILPRRILSRRHTVHLYFARKRAIFCLSARLLRARALAVCRLRGIPGGAISRTRSVPGARLISSARDIPGARAIDVYKRQELQSNLYSVQTS